MRNLFDDFLAELRRREAASRGEEPRPARPDSEDESADADDDLDVAQEVDEDGDLDAADEPQPIFERPRRDEPPSRGGPPRRRGPGGPNDGGRFGGRAGRAGRRVGLWVG